VATSLRDIERRAWLRTFEHGLWDIAIGLLLLSFGASILSGIYWMAAVWVPLAVPGLRDLARRLVVPRLGYVTFNARRERSTTRVSILLAALAVAGLGMFLVSSWSTRADAPAVVVWAQAHALVVIGLIWGGALAAAGWTTDYPRLYVYGVLLFAALLGSDLGLGYNMGHALTVTGGAITLVGGALLVRFVRRYPRHPEEEIEGHGA
jgi:hypothetical protein